MQSIESLREKYVGVQFFDSEIDELFSVIHIDNQAMAYLQYADGTPWDQPGTSARFSEENAERAGVEAKGLESGRYIRMESLPQLTEICDPRTHDWTPKPDEVWPDGPPEYDHERMEDPPQELYYRFSRCNRCMLSGAVAQHFGKSPNLGDHAPPWFCSECGDVFAAHNLEFEGDVRQVCPSCVDS
jgi:hypothetical protein